MKLTGIHHVSIFTLLSPVNRFRLRNISGTYMGHLGL